MHLRLAQPARRERDLAERRGHAPLVILLGALAAVAAVAGACTTEAPSADDVRVEWQVTPSPAVVGPATLRFSLIAAGSEPLAGGRFRIDGHMTHPGMAPVAAVVRETGPGAYEADLRFTMAGDWVLVLDGTLDDGRRLRRQLAVPGVQAER